MSEYLLPVVSDEAFEILSGRLSVSTSCELVLMLPVTSLPLNVVLSVAVSVSLAVTESCTGPTKSPVLISAGKTLVVLLLPSVEVAMDRNQPRMGTDGHG